MVPADIYHPEETPTLPYELVVTDVTAVPDWLQLTPFPTLTLQLNLTAQPPPPPLEDEVPEA